MRSLGKTTIVYRSGSVIICIVSPCSRMRRYGLFAKDMRHIRKIISFPIARCRLGRCFIRFQRRRSSLMKPLISLRRGRTRILLKRLERHHDGFRDLLDTLFAQVKGQLQRNRVPDEAVRLESSVFISAPQATTPFHFDPEVNFFGQIEGEKVYHLYAPSELAEDEVEPLYVRATTDIGQVDLGRRDPSAEHVFRLQPGGVCTNPKMRHIGSRQ